MANISITTDLDVIAKQRELVAEATGPDSAYILTKETLLDLFNKGDIKSTEQARIIAETIAGMSNSIAQNAMSVALQWAGQEKQLILEVEKTTLALELTASQIKISEENEATSKVQKNLALAELLKVYGTPLYDAEGDLVSLGTDGKTSKEIEFIITQNTELASNGSSRRSVETSQKAKIDKDVSIATIGEFVADQTKGDKILTSTYKKDVEKVTKDVAESALNGKSAFATVQLEKLSNETNYVKTQDTELSASVIYNNKIKALDSMADTYGTLGAGGLIVPANMWTPYFDIIDDLRDPAIGTTATVVSPTSFSRVAIT